MYKIAICDDEPQLLEYLHRICCEIMHDCGYAYDISTYHTMSDLFLQLKTNPHAFDLLLLDICMDEADGPNGMQLAQKLRSMGNRISIIFVTGSEEYLLEGYSVQPLQYLMKPVSKDALQKAINIDLKLNHLPKTVIFEAGKKRILLEFENILYIESMNHELCIHLSNETLTLPLSLNKAHALLPADIFCRCHKSYIINLYWVRSIARSDILLKNNETIPMGRSYITSVQSIFVRYLNRF